MRVRDVWLDFVNLRAENYTEDSRIPEMEFGTAKDDAFRRDLTINALFYNINEKKVEDFTERGIEDLASGIIRTPLPPRTTFLDDPLRILRAIRFAARFGFDVEEDIRTSASDPDVQHALKNKVSRERFGKEVLGMMKGRSPADAIALMVAFKISPVVLQVSTQNVVDAVTEDADRLSLYATRCVEKALEEISTSASWMDEENKVWLFLASWLLPYRNLSSEGKKGKTIPAVNDIISNALKLRSKDADTTVHVHESMDLAKELLANDEFSRLEAGLALRQMGPTWRLAVVLESLMGVLVMKNEEVPQWAADYAMHPADAPADVCERIESGVKSAVSKVSAVEKRVTELGLDSCWDLKPPVTGQEVMVALNMTKGGPELKTWIDRSMEWILEEPNISKEECIDRIKRG
jgi:tRNA nucleotidyltransferase (CCA-adding enzyme)